MHSLITRVVVCFTFAVALGANVCAAAKLDLNNLPPHPRLLMTAKGIAEMKDRIARFDWASAQWKTIKARADRDLTKEIVLPPRGGNWYHWYACPVHGCSLVTGKQIGEWQWEHKCPVGGEIIHGDPTKASRDYDSCVLSHLHDAWSTCIRDEGLAYQMTGDIRYANKARDIALAYAEKYLTYPIHNNQGEPKLGARIGSQNLDESTWLIPVCQGLDLIWDTLKDSDRETITNRLLLPAAKDVIKPHPQGVHNIQCWRNSAMGLVGLLIGDSDLVNYAINDPDTGFHTQMAKGVSPDGQWWEGAWGYHFYTMSAVWSLTEAARNCGIDLYCPEYKRMFDGPLVFAMPNMRLPAFNDSGEVGLGSGSAIYELAYARYKDPICLDLLSRSDRHNDFALFFGEPTLPAPPKVESKSANYPRSGYAILSKGQGEQATWLAMKYGPHGGGHGHPDKLNFVLYSKGQVQGVDPGTTRYGLPLQKEWHRTTLAHSTLTVDEESQEKAEGKCVAFGSDKGVDYAVCSAGAIYSGVDFNRTAAMVDQNLIVFIDQIKCDKPHTLDIAYHQSGAWGDLKGTEWKAPSKPGYMHLKDTTSRVTSDGVLLAVQANDGKGGISIGLAGGDATEVITATGVGKSTEDRVPVVIFRQKAAETCIAWFVSLDGKPVRIQRIRVPGAGSEADAAALSVTAGEGKALYLVANPRKKPITITLPDGSEWKTDQAFAVK